MNKNTKIVRKKAIELIATQRNVSYAIASFIIDCMTMKQRKKLFDKFRKEKF